MNKTLLWGILVWSLGILSFAQQFRISEYDGINITIEYPPCFDGAYLFVEQSTNLTLNLWETVDYSQVTLVPGDTIGY